MSSAPRRVPVIIDTDPGVDDIVALLLALASPELDILAIIVSYGNTDIESSYLNVFKTYRAVSSHLEAHPDARNVFPNFRKCRPILARGSSGPLEGPLHSAIYFHGRDGLGDITQRHSDLTSPPSDMVKITDRDGIDVAIDLLREHPARSTTYIALGPLTNLARLARKESSLLREKIGRIVCMGGALDVPGNTSPVAEFNFFADPYAVKELLVPAIPLGQAVPLDRFLLLPLDITTPHELPFPVYKSKVDLAFESSHKPSSASASKSPLTHFTSSFLERTREIMLQFGKDAMELHDIVAVWCAIENPPFQEGYSMSLGSGWKTSHRIFDIERTGELTRGMLVVDRRADESAYALGANRAEVQEEKDRVATPKQDLNIPAQVDVEKKPSDKPEGSEVLCVSGTPGPGVLLGFLLNRVWGVI